MAAPNEWTSPRDLLGRDGQFVVLRVLIGAQDQPKSVTPDQLVREFVHNARLDSIRRVTLLQASLGAAFDLVHRGATREHLGQATQTLGVANTVVDPVT